jgi:NAD(P)-dependent dehydrogenase (short-subunit alcohol dehydrogenase family)
LAHAAGDAHRKYLSDRTPSGVSFYKVEDINGTVVYLASDESSAVTGVTIPIDGGMGGVVTACLSPRGTMNASLLTR